MNYLLESEILNCIPPLIDIDNIIEFCEDNDMIDPIYNIDYIKERINYPVLINEEYIIAYPEIVSLFENYIVKPISKHDQVYIDCEEYVNEILDEVSLGGIKFGLKKRYIKHALDNMDKYSGKDDLTSDQVKHISKQYDDITDNLNKQEKLLKSYSKKLGAKNRAKKLEALKFYKGRNISLMGNFHIYNSDKKYRLDLKRKKIRKFDRRKNKDYVIYKVKKAKSKDGRPVSLARVLSISPFRKAVNDISINKHKLSVDMNLGQVRARRKLNKRNKVDFLRDVKEKAIKNRNIAIGKKIGVAALGTAAAGSIAYKLLKLSKKEKSPRTFIGKKIAAFRSLYKKMIDNAEKNPKKASLFQKVAAKILQIIDKLAGHLQRIAG